MPDGTILQDGTLVLRHFPFEIDDYWKQWLGTVRSNELDGCNLFFLRIASEGWPQGQLDVAGDPISERLMAEVRSIFALLRICGTIEYSNAFLLAGFVESGKPTCRHLGTLEQFKVTRGYLPWDIREADLKTAVNLAQAQAALRRQFPETHRLRFGRGCHVLKSALEQYHGDDRLHGFVRALEAIVHPPVRQVQKQFINRCGLFAAPAVSEAAAREVLQEVYRMRCDIEHIHDWDQSLKKYTADDREDVALWRTRQMEELACSVYRKILLDPALQPYFHSDIAIDAFWRKTPDEIRALFGNICDVTQMTIIRKYNYGRADASEWPPGLINTLHQQTAHP